MKKLLLSVLVAIAIILPTSVQAKEKVNVYIFSRVGCSYCAAAKDFFAELSTTEFGQYYTLVDLDIDTDKNDALGQKVANYFGDTFDGVPYIVIGSKTYPGYSKNYNDSIKSAIKEQYDSENYQDIVASMKSGEIVEEKADKTLGKGAVIAIVAIAVVGVVGFIYVAGRPEKK